MKKLIYCALALATGLFAASCQQENLEPVAQGNTVTFEISIPEVATKGLGDNVSNINDLVYAVYYTTASSLEAVQNGSAGYELLYQKNYAKDVNPFNGGNTAIIPIELVNDKNYFVIFWAQNEDRWVVGESFDLRRVAYPAEGMNANDNDYAAFSGISFITSDNLSAKKSVILKRPFAQINIGTQLATEFTITPTTSSVKVNKAGTSFNLIKQVAEGEGSVTFKTANVPTNPDRTEDGKLVVNNTAYTYAAMNYVFANGNVDVEYTINTAAHGAVSNKVANVPVAANYRTNIVGRLLTSTADYTVVLDEFDTNNNSGDIEVITEGLVKNQNGDYEITNENGLACAMNTLFTLGGDFYLTKELYDMTGYDVTSPSVPEGVTLRIFGETPIVTRSTVSVDGVTIKGLEDALIDVVKGNVFISGVNLPDTGSVLVNNNQGGNVIVTETTATELVAEGDAAVEADNVKNLATLKAALESEDVKVIEITADIEANEVITISKSVIINGNDHTLTTSANRAFRLTASEIEVVFNDLQIVSTATMIYPEDVRGVSIDPSLSNVILTLNDCTIRFTDSTTCDWTYAVNVSGSGIGHKVTVIGGAYEGANVINVHSAKNTVTVKDATLTSKYPASDLYYGACIWVLQNQESSVYAEGNTFEGYNAKAFNLGTGTALEEKDNVDNTMFYDAGVYYVASAEKLQKAIDKANTGNNIITLVNDIVGNVTLIQKENVKFTINGDDHKYNGTIKIHSNSNHYTTSAVTVENINFETATSSLNFIEALENGSERYSTNITVQECTFTATGDAVNTAVGLQIKSSNNAKVLNCTSTDMHSMVQANSCNSNVEVKGCTINGKGGVSFTQVKEATVENCAITVSGYGIRYDGRVDNYGITVKNNNITAAQPFIARKMTGANNTITLEGENTLTTDDIYQIVITNGSDDADYVTPTGTYTLTGADDFVVYPVVNYGTKVSDGLYKKANEYYVANAAGLAKMNKMFEDQTAGTNAVMNLVADIDFTGYKWTTVDSHADTRFWISEINGNDHTISNLTITGQAMFRRFAGLGDVTIKDITFDNANVNSNGNINTSILTVQSYQNVLLDNVDVKNSTIIGGYKVAPLIATVYNENPSATITATLKDCDVTNTTVKATSYDFCTAGMVAFVYEDDNDHILFENCSVKNVKLYAPNVYTAHAAVYTAGSDTLYNEIEGVTVESVTFENI